MNLLRSKVVNLFAHELNSTHTLLPSREFPGFADALLVTSYRGLRTDDTNGYSRSDSCALDTRLLEECLSIFDTAGAAAPSPSLLCQNENIASHAGFVIRSRRAR